MKKFLKWVAGIIIIILVAYGVGPKPHKPDFRIQEINLPYSLIDLEKQINESEKSIKGLKPDNQARIVWADTAKKEKTRVAILYLHGLLASQGEGAPVHTDLAKKYNANLYLARLPEHGIDRGDSSLISLTAEKLVASAEKDLEIAKKLGDEVVIFGTSTGGTLALYLTSKHPEIKALVLYSPCIKLYNPASTLLNKPWGLQIGRMVAGGPVMKDSAESREHAQYWTLKYRVEGIVALVNLYSNTMKPEVFSKVKCPVFLGYFYKNEDVQDKTASVAAMLKMFDELGTPAEFKQKTAFPDAGAHVIASPIRSKDWQGVERETDKFLAEIVKL
jgi:pimeloyl-ACP methyl ester carboxylesterase